MKHQYCLSRLFNLMGCGLLLLLLFGWLTPGRALAATGPLPLPDMLIYGTVVNATGDRLESGTLKALLNGQTIASAEIRAINGADYNYLLVVPMGMLAPGSTDRDSKMAIAGDVLSFTVDDKPAYYPDPFTSLTVNQLRIPADAAGGSVVLDLALSDAMRYLIGDVNANGTRNAADAMLTLKYDIGLILGVTSFPPGPNTVYLPLCDIVENGRCDSSDALRILQCDVGLSTVTCPVETIAAVHSADTPAPTADAPTHAASGDPIELQVTVAETDDAAGVDVSVLLADGADRFGAASFELHYDATLLTPTVCTANPGEVFDMVVCNLDYAPGVVRFNAVAMSGAANDAALATLRFQHADDATEQTPRFTLTADSVTDVDGAGMGWRVEPVDAPEAETQHWLFLPAVVGSDQRPAEQSPQEMPHSIFLPAVGGQFGQALESSLDAPEAGEQPKDEPSPEATVTPEATPTAEPTADGGPQTATATSTATPTAEPESANLSSPPFSLYLPAVGGGVFKATGSAPETPDMDAPPINGVEPDPEAESSRRGAMPVAALPSTSQQRSWSGSTVRRQRRRSLD
jgi:hypothetical protein